MEINANHVNSSKNGIIKAKAKLIHHGNFSMIYSINVTNNKNKLLSISRCTIALKKINI
jgi:uncharacterized protein (TIGR00369 family)